ncbi:MAG: hypothetical protein PHC34_07555 [Candidatus Gastranaerophilales bacterium]|nr:hypothetical protein [Candidatus Gastranaerophilales bacterium]
MAVMLKTRPLVKIIKLYGPIDETIKYSILKRRYMDDVFIYSVRKSKSFGDKLKIEQRNELKNSINKALMGKPRDLLRKINCNAFDAIEKQVPIKINREIRNTSDPSIIKILKQALEWTKGNYIDKWWP